MASFIANQGEAFQVKQLEVLQTSSNILNQSHSAAVIRGGKDVLLGQTPPPRNVGEAIQMFNRSIFGAPKDPFYYRSQYGNPIYNYLLIKGESATETQTRSQLSTLSSFRVNYQNDKNGNPNTWEVLDKDLSVENRAFPAIFMDSALMVVDKKKNIVKTKVVNRDSTRKEYISSGDYSVKISGVFTTNESNVYPVSDVEALIRACEAPIPLEIVSPYLFRFGITKLVVESYSFPQERGSYASQKFSISCISHNSSYAEISEELLNENQRKGIVGRSIDTVSNLYSTVETQIEKFFATNPL